jgi:hypothetical protein
MHVCLFCFFRISDSWLPNSYLVSFVYNHTSEHVYVCADVSVYVYNFFSLWVLAYSSWPNSMFLLNTGPFICTATSCRTCHRVFLQAFHRLSECACFSWLSTEILCLSECVCMFFFVSHSPGDNQTHYRDSRKSTSTRSCAHTFRDHSDTHEFRWWRVWRWFALDPHKHMQTQTHKYHVECLFDFLSLPDSWLPNSDSLSLLIQSDTQTCIFVCAMYFSLVFLLSIPYSWLPWLTLCSSTI